MEWIGFGSAIIMGTVLGVIGGGGSILTVPILVYLLSMNAVEATAYSLFVVGASSLVAIIDYFKRDLINVRVGLIFAFPAFLGVYTVRRYGIPLLPPSFPLFGLEFTKDNLILSIFALVMLVASLSMIRGRKDDDERVISIKYHWVLLEGLVVGAITGFVGAGGGFIIIPALVVLAGLNMKVAVGTSLFIISIKSLFGFLGDVQNFQMIQWDTLLIFTFFSMVGIFLGTRLSRKIPGAHLKPAFGWFVLIMGVAMLIQQLT